VTDIRSEPEAGVGEPEGDAVRLSVSAGSVYLSTVRAVAADLAMQRDLTLDEVDDLRLAVDEACSMLVPLAVPGGELDCVFQLSGDEIRVRCSVPSRDGHQPPTDGFSWQVLAALADDARSEVSHDGGTPVASIELVKRKLARA
jgi:serine/threonine-protein kinase RsbW